MDVERCVCCVQAHCSQACGCGKSGQLLHNCTDVNRLKSLTTKYSSIGEILRFRAPISKTISIYHTVVQDFWMLSECTWGGRMDKTNPVTSNNRYILDGSVTTPIDQWKGIAANSRLKCWGLSEIMNDENEGSCLQKQIFMKKLY